MTARSARILTCLYARDWRARYGAEFEALLREMPATPAVAADVLANAVATRRRELMFGVVVALALVGLGSASQAGQSGARVAVRYLSVPVSDSCRTYSSTTASGWIARQQCTD